MTYELAKQLKDAGFPQESENGSIVHAEGCDWKTVPCAQSYCPTLEELIEACGEDFFELHRVGRKWCAASKPLEDKPRKAIQFGSTPTEAVARLWLALNK